MTSVHHDLAIELVALLAGASNRSMSIVAAKDAFCGRTRPIRELHAAMGYAHASGWLVYSDDYLRIRLQPLGLALAARAAMAS